MVARGFKIFHKFLGGFTKFFPRPQNQAKMDEHLSFEDFSALPEKEKYAHFKNMQQKTGDHQPAMNAVPQSKENENKLAQQKKIFKKMQR